MGSRWFTGGVSAAPRGRIQFDFRFEGVRYRPTIKRPPSEANLRRARERLDVIKQQIGVGTFSFAEEFPDYRFLRRVNGSARVRSCNDVLDDFLAHCEARLGKGDLAPATFMSYRRVLNGVWRPSLGKQLFHQVRYSALVRIATRSASSDVPSISDTVITQSAQRTSPKKRPAADRSFSDSGRRNAHRSNPSRLRRSPRKLRRVQILYRLAPFGRDRPVLTDLDLANGIVSIHRAGVAGIERNCTKTGEDRRVVLCPRALLVLKEQLALRARLEAECKIDHDYVFVQSNGALLSNLQYPQGRRCGGGGHCGDQPRNASPANQASASKSGGRSGSTRRRSRLTCGTERKSDGGERGIRTRRKRQADQ